MITKINRSAEIIFNHTSSTSVGIQISEFLGVKNNHFLMLFHKLTHKDEGQEEKKDDSGQIGGDASRTLSNE